MLPGLGKPGNILYREAKEVTRKLHRSQNANEPLEGSLKCLMSFSMLPASLTILPIHKLPPGCQKRLRGMSKRTQKSWRRKTWREAGMQRPGLKQRTAPWRGNDMLTWSQQQQMRPARPLAGGLALGRLAEAEMSASISHRPASPLSAPCHSGSRPHQAGRPPTGASEWGHKERESGGRVLWF